MSYTFELGFFNNVTYQDYEYANFYHNTLGNQYTGFDILDTTSTESLVTITIGSGGAIIGGWQVICNGTESVTINNPTHYGIYYIYLRYNFVTQTPSIITSTTRLSDAGNFNHMLLYAMVLSNGGMIHSLYQGDWYDKHVVQHLTGTADNFNVNPQANLGFGRKLFVTLQSNSITNSNQLYTFVNSDNTLSNYMCSTCEFSTALTGDVDVSQINAPVVGEFRASWSDAKIEYFISNDKLHWVASTRYGTATVGSNLWKTYLSDGIYRTSVTGSPHQYKINNIRLALSGQAFSTSTEFLVTNVPF